QACGNFSPSSPGFRGPGAPMMAPAARLPEALSPEGFGDRLMPRPHSPRSAPGFRPTLEALEERLVLDTGIHVVRSGAGLTITGTALADTVTVADRGPSAHPTGLVVTVQNANGSRKYTYGTRPAIVFNGGDGDDVFTSRSSRPSEAHGGPGNDVLTGGGGPDV